jgi:hypothetical protein
MVLMSTLVLAGCAAPKVQYERNPSGQVKAPRFQLADSIISFAYPTKQGGNGGVTTDASTVQILSVPVALTAETWSMAGTRATNNWGVSTLLKVSHRENTLLLQEVGSEAVDRRVQALTALGQIGANLIPLIYGSGISTAGAGYVAPDPTSLKMLVQTGKCKRRADDGSQVDIGMTDDVPEGEFMCDNVQLNGNYWVTDATGVITNQTFTGKFVVNAVPRETTATKDLQPHFTSDSVFYSACRDVRVELHNSLMANTPMAVVRVSDPAHIEWLGLPDKGKITFAASCGADIVSEDANLPTGVDMVNALISSAAAIKRAKEAE